MTIACPACDTVFRLPPSAQPGSASFRCSRCDHVFRPEAPADPPPPPPARAPARETPRATARAADEDEDDSPGDALDDAEAPEPRRGPTTARFALHAFVATTIVFGLLSIYAYMHRSRVIDRLAGIPIVGERLALSRLRPEHIQLTDVKGEYARAGGDTLVFLISGTAVNNAAEPVSAIQIKGRIVGGTEQERLVYAGAAPHDVHDLSTREIDLLQTLEPPHDWRLLPGEDGDFLVAFVDPPQPLQEFRVEVAAVQRRRPPPSDH